MGTDHDSRHIDPSSGNATQQKSGDCILSKRLPHDHSIDTKSVFDAMIEECSGSRQDRRIAVDLAIVRVTLKGQGSHIRWIPHPLMPADWMTEVEPSTGNDALTPASYGQVGMGPGDDSMKCRCW